MQNSQSGRTLRHWENVTDDELLNVELTTDDPLGVENLVTVLPSGDEEPYVEFKYDFRKSSQDKMRCCLCHQRHLAGFVMKQVGARFLIGHICGTTVYGESFDAYTSDYSSAVNRQTAHRRRLEIRSELNPFLEWIRKTEKDGVFHEYIRLRQKVLNRLPWIWENATKATALGYMPRNETFPTLFFERHDNPELELQRVLSETETLEAELAKSETLDDTTVYALQQRLRMLLRRTENAIKTLGHAEKLFQPSILSGLCDFANDCDNPKSRKYSFGLMSLTCKSKNGDTTSVQVPSNFAIPRLADLDRLRLAINQI